MSPGRVCVTALLHAVLVVFPASGVLAQALAPFSAMASGEVASPWRVEGIRGRPMASFRVIDVEGGIVEAVSSGSVAGLIHPVDVDPATAPLLQWRWRIFDAVEESDPYRKSGDDYPARVYVMFDYDPGRLPFLTRWQLRLARLIYGDLVPAAALCYVPVARVAQETIVPNAYSERTRMIVVDNEVNSKGWRVFTRDIVRDFQTAFGEPSPRIIGIAIATDTDDTGETARAWFGDVILSPQLQLD